MASVFPEVAGTAVLVPSVRVRTETLTVEEELGELREAVLPVVELSFDYGGVSIRSSDRRPRFFATPAGGAAPVEVERDLARERDARYLLESFGAVELACLDGYSAAPGSRADYVVRVEEDVHALCSFTANA